MKIRQEKKLKNRFSKKMGLLTMYINFANIQIPNILMWNKSDHWLASSLAIRATQNSQAKGILSFIN